MLVKYCELLYPAADGKSKFLGWYQCDREDFFEYFQKKPKSVWMIGVELADGRRWHWSRKHGWTRIKTWKIDKRAVIMNKKK